MSLSKLCCCRKVLRMVSFYVDCVLILTEVNERAVTARVSMHGLAPCFLVFLQSCYLRSIMSISVEIIIITKSAQILKQPTMM